MSWFREDKRTWMESWCIRLLKEGPIPSHVAIIMDGNRRFATKNSMAQVKGHVHGFDKLAQALQWCRDVGIKEVTVYAFSIENFKRSSEEVDGVMELAREKFKMLLEEKEKIKTHGVCIRVMGNLTLLPEDIQALVAEVTLYSKDNDECFLNVCFAYTARDEITTAIRDLATGIDEGVITPNDVSESLMEKTLYTKSNHPDLLIRTSGEIRLSDFLLWQSCYSVLAFIKVLWPEFSIWHLFFAIFFYQRAFKVPHAAEEESRSSKEAYEEDDSFKHYMDECLKTDPNATEADVRHGLGDWKAACRERQETYLSELDRRREQKLIEALNKEKCL